MPTWITLQRISDERGSLVIAEAQKNIPFEIKRVYCLYDMNEQPRGFHAHKKLQQVMVCLSGSCDVILDNGQSRELITLTKESKGLLITGMCWREMSNYSHDCVLMVLASDYYDEADYIRDYENFLNQNLIFHSKNLKFRPVEIKDADFILKLRLDQRYNKFISKVDDSIENQIQWIKEYKEDEKVNKQYYFIIERFDGVPCGTIRIYNIINNCFTWGSWILNQDKIMSAALESALLIYKIGFNHFGFERAYFDVLKDNKNVVNFHKIFGADLIREDELNYYFEMRPDKIKEIQRKFRHF